MAKVATSTDVTKHLIIIINLMIQKVQTGAG